MRAHIYHSILFNEIIYVFYSTSYATKLYGNGSGLAESIAF